MNLKRLTEQARKTIEARGGTDRLKHDAERLKDIATGKGTAKEKAKAAAEALKRSPVAADPAPADPSVDTIDEGGPVRETAPDRNDPLEDGPTPVDDVPVVPPGPIVRNPDKPNLD